MNTKKHHPKPGKTQQQDDSVIVVLEDPSGYATEEEVSYPKRYYKLFWEYLKRSKNYKTVCL